MARRTTPLLALALILPLLTLTAASADPKPSKDATPVSEITPEAEAGSETPETVRDGEPGVEKIVLRWRDLTPEQRDRLRRWLERHRRERVEGVLDICEFGRQVTQLPACTTPEECEAYRQWRERMPDGPMAAIPVPEGAPRVMPAAGLQPPRPRPWPGVVACPAGR